MISKEETQRWWVQMIHHEKKKREILQEVHWEVKVKFLTWPFHKLHFLNNTLIYNSSTVIMCGWGGVGVGGLLGGRWMGSHTSYSMGWSSCQLLFYTCQIPICIYTLYCMPLSKVLDLTLKPALCIGHKPILL